MVYALQWLTIFIKFEQQVVKPSTLEPAEIP